MDNINCVVEASNQLVIERRVSGDGKNGRPRVLFVGNSITLHDAKPDIGWFNNWGMAASDIRKDYVHQTMSMIRSIKPEASFRIAQVAEWERLYWKKHYELESFSEVVSWHPDIIIVRIGENVPLGTFDDYPFTSYFLDMIDYFNPKGKSKVFITTLFKQREKINRAISKASYIRKIPLVDISYLGANNEMTALGLFQHQGVATHPGDKGMLAIAKAIFKAVEPIL